jgi:hypothetical protein
MWNNEKTSKEIATLASLALKHPEKLTLKQIRTLAGTTLTQTPDKKAPKKKGK